MAGSPRVGVLALQGAFAKHIEILKKLGASTIEVRNSRDLEQCDRLVIPGGESTTMIRLLRFYDMEQSLQDFGKSNPILGTCAGIILMAREIAEDSITPFGFLDITVERNAYGRQAESFRQQVPFGGAPFAAMFIRAPRILSCGPNVEILSDLKGEAILVRDGLHLGATFHPELSSDTRIHRAFLEYIPIIKS